MDKKDKSANIYISVSWDNLTQASGQRDENIKLPQMIMTAIKHIPGFKDKLPLPGILK